jgi:mannose-1-phosphate guanylyltransferase
MGIDGVLILCAGQGTRMGHLSKILPKPLWPVFQYSLLELQLWQLKTWGIQVPIYCNIFHQSSLLLQYIQDQNIPVTPVIENEVLDVGGGIHHFAKKMNYQGQYLVMNCDQFWFPVKSMPCFLKEQDFEKILLYATTVSKESRLNEIKVEDRLLKEIVMYQEEKIPLTYTTFSGISKIKFNSLAHIEGKSSFFQSVADYKQNPIHTFLSSQEENFLDLGTLENYKECLFSLVSPLDSSHAKKKWWNELRNYFLLHQVLDGEEIHLEQGSYGNTSSKHVINFQEDVKEVRGKGQQTTIFFKEILLDKKNGNDEIGEHSLSSHKVFYEEGFLYYGDHAFPL